MPVEQRREYYAWTPQSKSLTVRIDLGVIDRINVEVMRGFGVARRRGTEPGGILLGSIVKTGEPVITVDEFETVPCEYSQGPSYILSPADLSAFTDAMERWRPSPDRDLYPVGYWRGHTRDGLDTDTHDLALMERHFRDPLAFALLVKPFATRANTGRIFLREGSALQGGAEFPFTRGGRPSGEPVRPIPRDIPRVTSAPEQAEPRPAAPAPAGDAPPRPPVSQQPEEIVPVRPDPVVPIAAPEPAAPPLPMPIDRPLFTEFHPRPASTWKRIVLRIAYTLAAVGFGAVAGHQYAGGNVTALSGASGAKPPVAGDAYNIHLAIRVEDGSALISWDKKAAPVVSAQRAELTITDGGASKVLSLASTELQSGTVLYHPSGSSILLRFELFLQGNRSLVQVLTWSPPSAAPAPAP